ADWLPDLVSDRPGPFGRIHPAGRQPEVLANRQAVEETRDLGLHPDPSPRDGVRVMAGDVVAPKQNAPGRRLELPGEQLEQRALASAVGPDETAQLPLGKREIDAADGLDAAEADRQADGLKHRATHARSRTRARPTARMPARRSEGTMPRGTNSTKARKMMPKIRLVFASCCVPRVVARYCMMRQPMMGPTSVPRPPTMTQMMIWEVMVRLNTLGPTKAPQLANRQPARPAMPPPIANTRSLRSLTS